MFSTPVSDVFKDRLSVSRPRTPTSLALPAVAPQTSKTGISTSSTSSFLLPSSPLSGSAPSSAFAGHCPFFGFRCFWGCCACFTNFPVMHECSWPSPWLFRYPCHWHTGRASPESRRRGGTAVTLQKFNRDDFEATEVYATMSEIEHVHQSLRDVNSACVAEKSSFQENVYDYIHGVISVIFLRASGRKCASWEAVFEGWPARYALKNEKGAARWWPSQTCRSARNDSREPIGRKWSHTHLIGVHKERPSFNAAWKQFPTLHGRKGSKLVLKEWCLVDRVPSIFPLASTIETECYMKLSGACSVATVSKL